jgi:hypothetical protein
MRTLIALAATAGAAVAVQAAAATPAAAYGYCNPYGHYYARPCCPRYWGPVTYRVVGYPPAARYWRHCCRW